jgi:hypothetical protein
MPNIRTAIAPSPWSVRLQFDGVGSLSVATYTLVRKDSGPGTPSIVTAFNPFPADSSTVELTLSSPLLEATIFTVGQGGTSFADVAYYASQTTAAQVDPADDAEAEAFYVDLDWVDGDPDASGDCPKRRGLESYRHDLKLRPFIAPGELVHLPDTGGGMLPSVNSPATDAELQEDAARVEADLRNDPRTDQVFVDPNQKNDGVGELQISAKPVALDVFIKVTSDG